MDELAPLSEPQPDLTGQVIDQRFELVRLLGRGGMGAVYEATSAIGKRFAIKLLVRPDLVRHPGLVNRFFREAKAAAGIESAHIVEVFDTGTDGATGLPFILMELLRGEDLEKVLAHVESLEWVGACRVIAQAALGLADAHAAGIIHRDVKPANIFLHTRTDGEGVVKLLDFGIAKQAMEFGARDHALTRTGSIVGTPLYMSPEQAQGSRQVDGRSDVWSLAMCLYESLAGRLPWGAELDTLGGLIVAICTQDPTPLRKVAPWVPAELESLVHWGLQRDPQRRLTSARALYDALLPFCDGSTSIELGALMRRTHRTESHLSVRLASAGAPETISAEHPGPEDLTSVDTAIGMPIGASMGPSIGAPASPSVSPGIGQEPGMERAFDGSGAPTAGGVPIGSTPPDGPLSERSRAHHLVTTAATVLLHSLAVPAARTRPRWTIPAAAAFSLIATTALLAFARSGSTTLTAVKMEWGKLQNVDVAGPRSSSLAQAVAPTRPEGVEDLDPLPAGASDESVAAARAGSAGPPSDPAATLARTARPKRHTAPSARPAKRVVGPTETRE